MTLPLEGGIRAISMNTVDLKLLSRPSEPVSIEAHLSELKTRVAALDARLDRIEQKIDRAIKYAAANLLKQMMPK